MEITETIYACVRIDGDLTRGAVQIPMIRVVHLSHSFGPHWALKDCTFTLAKGEFLFLSGPSGAGKTTLLRILYGALPIQRGDAQIVDFSLTTLKPKELPLLRRQVSVVFQDFKILPGKSVFDNIALPLQVRGLAPFHIERRVRAVSKALSLDAQLHTSCAEISGGEQQRVAVARAFVVNPQVLLADEPTGNLDPDLSLRLMDLFMQFQTYGTTVIFATHSLDLLRRHPGARLLRLEDGMITYANWPGALLFKREGAPPPSERGNSS
jgi:cell division transport system ATP-binding protein